MPSRKREAELFDALYARMAPLLPPHLPQPKGGRPFASDKACLEGIVYVLRNGIRWNAMPRCFPSSTTCWKRFDAWTKLGIMPQIHELVVAELDDAGLLDTSELAMDATFVEAQKGGIVSAPQSAA